MTEKKKIKCVVWDLDNTVWSGILPEGDHVEIKPGIRDIIAELDRRGVLHSIASKGNHDDAMKKLAEMGLAEFFLYPEINWNAKSRSIASIAKNLHIGLDTFLFIDDQPFERDDVKSALPEVTCVDAADYVSLLEMPSLNPVFVTDDSQKRRQLYIADRQRKLDESQFEGPRSKFLEALDISIRIYRAKEEDLQRAEELTLRTNQLNATGQTYSYDELKAFSISENHRLLVCDMHDRYGHYGKIGLALVETTAEQWRIKLLLMSCRVMSLGVGTVLLIHILRQAQQAATKVLADFRHTGRNRMMYVTYKFANFRELQKDEDGYVLLENDLSVIQRFPDYAKISIG